MSLKNALRNSIIFYHNYISPYMLCHCRYYPSCSKYTLDAIEDKGPLLGLLAGFRRIMRCSPLFPGGYDPYPSRSKLFSRESVRQSDYEKGI